MNLFCVGISHHTAKVETRERYALQRSEEALRTESGCDEALMLATCNRVEVYGSASVPVATERITRCLVRGREKRRRTQASFIVTKGKNVCGTFSASCPVSTRW